MWQVKAGLDAIYLSGWQVAGDANLAGAMSPDQSQDPYVALQQAEFAAEQEGYTASQAPA